MRVGIVLGAGGYVGWPFQMAVLDAIERRTGIDTREVEVLVGTSVGAFTSLLLRAGFGPNDLVRHVHGWTMSDEAERLLHEQLDPPGSLPPRMPSWRPPVPLATGLPTTWWSLAGQGRRRNWVPAALSTLSPRGTVDHSVFERAADSLLPTWPSRRTWIVAMRASDGERRVFGRDAHATPGRAALASSAIPGYFRPVVVGGEDHVDAGVLSSTNADLLADDHWLDLVVVVPSLAGASWRPAIDMPMRALVDAQIAHEVAVLESAGLRVEVARPPWRVVRAMQGDPIRASGERIRRVVDVTAAWADVWARESLPDADEVGAAG